MRFKDFFFSFFLESYLFLYKYPFPPIELSTCKFVRRSIENQSLDFNLYPYGFFPYRAVQRIVFLRLKIKIRFIQ